MKIEEASEQYQKADGKAHFMTQWESYAYDENGNTYEIPNDDINDLPAPNFFKEMWGEIAYALRID